MKTKLLAVAALVLLASSAFAATPTYLFRLYSPGVKGAAAAANTYATWNPADMGPYSSLANNNLSATGSSAGWTMVRATQGKSSGKWYWEITDNVASTVTAGITTGPSVTPISPYTWAYGLVGYATAFFVASNSNITYGSSKWAVAGSTLGVALDMDAKQVTYYLNGISQGVVPFTLPNAQLFPFVSQYANTITADFGATPFKYPVPAGYHAGVFE